MKNTMKRRDFLKFSIAAACSTLIPEQLSAATNISNVDFDSDIYDKNNQTIIVFLNGGPSALSGNLSNLDEINKSSQQDYYSHFGKGYLSKVEGYDLWKQAGGDSMKNMLDRKEMTLIRTCYSAEREKVNNKSHGPCTLQNMRGNFDLKQPGILTSLSRVMDSNGKYDQNTLPFMTLSGENPFYAGDSIRGVKPVSLNYALANPFNRNMTSSIWFSKEERKISGYTSKLPVYDLTLDVLAKSNNSNEEMNTFLKDRKILDEKVRSVVSDRDIAPNDPRNNKDKYLKTYGYTETATFHRTLATAIELLDSNTSTRTITIGTGGLGGWDDHSFCKVTYTRRMQNLFQALEAGMRHLDGINKKNKISIIVYGEFGRNVNLNNSLGFDHGNGQNLFILGGTDTFNHVGGTDAIVGETVVDNGGQEKSGRIWLKPKDGSYQCDPLSVAAMIYSLHGIKNPEVLTGGYGVINPKVKGQDFLKA